MRSIPFQLHDMAESQVEELVKKSQTLLQGLEFSTLAMACSFSPTFSAEKISLIRKEVQAVVNRKLIELYPSTQIQFEHPDVFLRADFPSKTLFLELKPVYLYARYNKFQRGIAQTYHYCRFCKGRTCHQCNYTGKQSEESVQELLAQLVLPVFESSALVFHGSGREDADVRMLGNGRPFMMELQNPIKRSADLALLESKINQTFTGKIGITQLRFAKKEEVAIVKHPGHEKRYEALIETTKALDATTLDSLLKKLNQKIDVAQFTPTRVEKRRAALTRTHYVFIEKIIPVDSTHFRIQIKTSPGCYVKEFISGDNDRSKPSIAELIGLACVCKELDVLEILEK